MSSETISFGFFVIRSKILSSIHGLYKGESESFSLETPEEMIAAGFRLNDLNFFDKTIDRLIHSVEQGRAIEAAIHKVRKNVLLFDRTRFLIFFRAAKSFRQKIRTNPKSTNRMAKSKSKTSLFDNAETHRSSPGNRNSAELHL